MEPLDVLEVKIEIDDGSLSSFDDTDNSAWDSQKKGEVETEINTTPANEEELNVDNNIVENMKALTDLQQHAMESNTDCSLSTEQTVGNHSRYEDNWRSHSPLVKNSQESIIFGDELEEDQKIFYLNPSSPNEDAPPEFEKVFVHDIHLDKDDSASEEERNEQMSWNEQPCVGHVPQPGCSSWSDEVDHQRGRDLDSIPFNSKELAEERVGACDPLVRNNPEATKNCVGSEKDNRTLIPCSNTTTLNNTLTVDDEVYICKQEEYFPIPVEVIDKETDTPTMQHVDKEIFIATYSEQSNTHNTVRDRMIMDNYVCNSCDFETPSLKIFKSHMMKEHSHKKQFHCKFCDYKCSLSANLKIHERTHTGEKPFNCKFCDFKCSRSSNLKYHEKTHTGEKRFHCKFCDYKCAQRSNLKRHERSHTGEKPFNCEFCDFKCSLSSNLKIHERTHTGEKPFNCKFCDYKSTQSSSLKAHERIHTGEKPFQCKLCYFKCHTSSHLNLHERTHF